MASKIIDIFEARVRRPAPRLLVLPTVSKLGQLPSASTKPTLPTPADIISPPAVDPWIYDRNAGGSTRPRLPTKGTMTWENRAQPGTNGYTFEAMKADLAANPTDETTLKLPKKTSGLKSLLARFDWRPRYRSCQR